MPAEIPKYVLAVLARLEERGHSAHLVGGCVRDLLLGRRPNDWDVTTSALPEEIMAAFPKTRPTGLRHGTVTVITKVRPIEITTYRADGEYRDHRRPETVEFLPDISGDLARRDFTVNAMALSCSGELLDFFGGREDLQNRLIRCVGDPDRRFGEDALRMLRAFRFSAQLGFALEAKTRASILNNAKLSGALARERVAVELEKTLLSPAPETVAEFFSSGLLSGLADESDAGTADFRGLNVAPRKRRERWSALCALLLRQRMLSDAARFLLDLRLDTATVKAASRGAVLALSGAPEDETAWKRLLCENGEDACRCCAAACDALDWRGGGGLYRSIRTGENVRARAVPANTGGKIRSSALLLKTLKSGELWQLSQLCVGGTELAALGITGKAVGETLHALLLHVVDIPADNNEETLLALAAAYKNDQIGANAIERE